MDILNNYFRVRGTSSTGSAGGEGEETSLNVTASAEGIAAGEQPEVTVVKKAETVNFNFKIPAGKQGEKGDPGVPGRDGMDGQDGTPGTNGEDGRGIVSAEINDEKKLILHYSDEMQDDLGVVVGADGKDGAAGQDGKNGTTFTQSVSEDGVLTWENDGSLSNPPPVSIKGKDGQNGERGERGEQGLKGDRGDSTYLAWDKHLWIGKNKTDWILPASLDTAVFEHSTEVAGPMAPYFDGEFIDLSSSYVALMPYWKKAANITLYSDMSITEITAYCESEGTLQIGVSGLKDIVDAKLMEPPYLLFMILRVIL